MDLQVPVCTYPLPAVTITSACVDRTRSILQENHTKISFQSAFQRRKDEDEKMLTQKLQFKQEIEMFQARKKSLHPSLNVLVYAWH